MANAFSYDLSTIQQSITALNGLKVIHSDEVKDVFGKMKNETFEFNYETIEAEEAKTLVELIKFSELIFELQALMPELNSLIPAMVQEAMANAYSKLNPWKRFLTKVANSEDFNREKSMMKVVASQVNQQFLHNKLGS